MKMIKYKVNQKVDDFLCTTNARNNLLYGSAGSGKSWGIALHLIFEKAMCQPNVRFLVTRTTGPALTNSCWLLVNDVINTYELDVNINKTNKTITFANNAQMFFVAMDDVKKFKSMEKMNYIWCEEATEIAYQEYMQLDLRCRGENPYGINQLYFSFNPDDENSFLKGLCDNPPSGTAVHHSTYKDNAFNTPDYRATIERLKDNDHTYWLIYGLGIWATPTGIIFSNWDIVKDADWPTDFDEIIYGLDFGFTNPSALVEIGIREMDLYVKEQVYKTHLTTPMLIDEIKQIPTIQDHIIYADAAQPGTIKEIHDSGEGFIVLPAAKGPDSVIAGIRAVMSYNIHIHEESVHAQKEIRGYKWRTDKNGEILDKEMPVKFNDHIVDAIRYSVFTHKDAYIPEIVGVW